jgi:hypothetical protein
VSLGSRSGQSAEHREADPGNGGGAEPNRSSSGVWVRARFSASSDLREATLAALHELTERLTAISNYLTAALRLSQTDATAAGISLRHTEILEKAFGQVSQADEAIKQLRRLMDEDAGRAGTPSARE